MGASMLDYININKNKHISRDETYQFFRSSIQPWRESSIRNGRNKCVLTGSDKYEVHHHKKSFIVICEEALNELNLKYYGKLSKYTVKEKEQLAVKILQLHYKHGLGELISKEHHKNFHLLYGFYGFTAANWKEYKRKYKMDLTRARVKAKREARKLQEQQRKDKRRNNNDGNKKMD